MPKRAARPRALPLPFRIGHGYDIHRLRRRGRLVLGGIEVARNLSPIAHSDGDVVLHALVDALMGAMGLGDIGEHFPNDPKWKNAPSEVFVQSVHQDLKRLRYEVMNVDLTILAEKPRLKDFKPAMKQSIARMLKVLPDQINIKAGTNERCDSIGKGLAIACHAVILLVKAPPLTAAKAALRRPVGIGNMKT